ncbi:predicted protein [Sclerotinia sclerotiorum 1980 UF-70]|uniref:Uncharacterized protein n=1 Tax=Sclerotinia sclerotiorum (strain ATCC 18683 / 1980 / Ss-1) TaxID=665079 RepID=A7EHM1_SCLS1|nr:predicted protein [Sclerotinia sclerotiorum 1980 UF-70]EDO02337.1 predicted protein [Sclerotinia sclerotiorum 1980 UF-70]
MSSPPPRPRYPIFATKQLSHVPIPNVHTFQEGVSGLMKIKSSGRSCHRITVHSLPAVLSTGRVRSKLYIETQHDHLIVKSTSSYRKSE